MSRYLTVLAAPLVAAVLSTDGMAEEPAPSFQVKNVGFSVAPLIEVEHGRVVFAVSELEQGGFDYNFDGDALDLVLHLYDSISGSLQNLQPAIVEPFVMENDHLAFLLRESSQKLDVNQDGDQNDDILMVYDVASGQYVNFGLAVWLGGPVIAGSRMLFAASETHSAGTDLNGDGDAIDNVVHIHDFATGSTINLGVAHENSFAGANLSMSTDVAAFLVSEWDEGGVDLNSDGDNYDAILYTYEPVLGLAGSRIAVDPRTRPIVAGTHVAFFADEAANGGVDLNGDGDAFDRVPHVFDRATGLTTNLGVAASKLEFDGNLLVFHASENSNGATDLNGDGDTGDDVVHVVDVIAGTVTNLALSSHDAAVDHGRAAFLASEIGQGADLNGDGDQFDEVIHVYDQAASATLNLGLAGSSVALKSDLVVTSVPEWFEANADLNGDGNVFFDSVVYVHDLLTGTTRNLGVTGFAREIHGGRVTIRVSEAAHGGRDLNGDGDAVDDVLMVYDRTTGVTINPGLASFESVLDADHVVVRVREKSQGDDDLNGDQDTDDFILHDVAIAPFHCGSILPYGSGCAGAASRVPDAILNGCPQVESKVTLTITRGVPGASVFVVFGTGRAAVPFGAACTLNVTPLFPIAVGPLPLNQFGSLAVDFAIPAGTPSGTVTMQAFIDVGVEGQFSGTPGIELITP